MCLQCNLSKKKSTSTVRFQFPMLAYEVHREEMNYERSNNKKRLRAPLSTARFGAFRSYVDKNLYEKIKNRSTLNRA